MEYSNQITKKEGRHTFHRADATKSLTNLNKDIGHDESIYS